jgi:copper chaperone CopZ
MHKEIWNMRLLICLALGSFLICTGCAEQAAPPAAAPAAEPVSFNTEGLPVVEIDVPGLHCENCSATACTLLADVPGVVDVKADPETKKATIAVDQSKFDSEAARTALEDQFGEATIVDDHAATELTTEGENS